MKETMSHIGGLQKRYWTEFRAYLAAKGSKLEPMGNPLPLSWHAFRLTKATERMEAVITSRGEMRIELYLTGEDARHKYIRLRELCEHDAADTLGKVVWPKDNHRRQKAYLRHDADLNNSSKWQQQFDWMRHTLEAMHGYFGPKLKDL